MANMSQGVADKLGSLFGNRVTFDMLERKLYAHDMGVIPSMVRPFIGNPIPDAVVQPITEHELVELVLLANQEAINLIPRGKATSGYGGVLPVDGGVVVEFNRMNKILDIDPVNRTATVEPGVVWKELEYHLNQAGLSLALYPTSFPSSTVGGWLAQGGAGIGSYEFGYFRENVQKARIVQPDGSVKEFSGPDLDLVSGANGITGFISQVTINVKPLRPLSVSALAFENVEDLGRFLNGLYARRIPLWSVTFINPDAARMKNRFPRAPAPWAAGTGYPESYASRKIHRPPRLQRGTLRSRRARGPRNRGQLPGRVFA